MEAMAKSASVQAGATRSILPATGTICHADEPNRYFLSTYLFTPRLFNGYRLVNTYTETLLIGKVTLASHPTLHLPEDLDGPKCKGGSMKTE